MENKSYPTQTEINPTFKQYPIEISYWDDNPDAYSYKMPHRHQFDEVLFFRKGGGTHEINFTQYPIEDYSIHLVKTNTVHFLQRDKKSVGFNIAFDTMRIVDENPMLGFPFLNNLNPVKGVEVLRKDQFEELDKIIEILFSQIKEKDSFYKDKCFLLAFELIVNKLSTHLLLNDNKNENCHAENEVGKIVEAFQNLVKKHYLYKHKVEWYASKLHVSSSHLYRMCSDEIHMSPKELIQQRLVKEAKRLLLESNLNCKQLAFEIGFESASYFHTFFKNQTGLTPGEYAQEIRRIK